MTQEEEHEEQTATLVDGGGAVLADVDAERELLGAMISDAENIAVAIPHVGPDDFWEPVHRVLYRRLVDSYEAGYVVGAKSLVEAIGGDAPMFAAIAATMTERPVAELAQYIQECAERRFLGDDDAPADFAEPFRSKFGLVMWADQNDPGPEYEYLVEDLIPEGEPVLIIGESQTGKSFLTYHLGMCGARGVDFFGRRILEPFGVVYCAYEAGKGFKNRMRAYRRAHEIVELEDLPFAVLTRPANLWSDAVNIDELIAEIEGIKRAKFRGVRLGAVVIDTHNSATTGASEVNSEEVSVIRERYRKITAVTGASVWIVSHKNAAGKHRGNEQLYNNIETCLDVSRKLIPIDAKHATEAKDNEGRAIRTLKVRKQREGIDGETWEFVLRVIDTGSTNKFGKARTSCVVTPPSRASDEAQVGEDQPKPGGFKLSDQEAMFFGCVLDALAQDGIAPPAGINVPRSVTTVVDYKHVKSRMARKMLREDDDTDAGKKRHAERVKTALKRARTTLTRYGVIGADSPHIWWTGKPVRGFARTQPRPAQADFISAGEGDDLVDLVP
jgi:hypothetical protein